jgi:phenylpropionate dioxygenase-like ring-hydroxylating dioxygenase large terminal subunit
VSELPPFPTGWYALCFADELGAGQLLSGRWFGRELVVWRSGSGRVAVMDAHCPHLGAHLGHGGRVEGDAVRCPFHGFRFDGDGACVGAYGGRPPKVRAGTWPVAERDGVVLTWFDAAGRPPGWEVPVADSGGFGPLHHHTWPSLRTHPQETSENSVDLGHFAEVHGYTEVRELAPVQADGPVLRTRYSMTRANPFVPFLAPIRTEFDVAVHGLGFSRVDARIEGQALRTRHLVLATPVDDGVVELRIGVAVEVRSPGQIARPLGWIPRRWITALVGSLALRAYRDDVSQDFRIWQHKRWVDPPGLAEGDGPVGPYRRWARQFYPGGVGGAHPSMEPTPT